MVFRVKLLLLPPKWNKICIFPPVLVCQIREIQTSVGVIFHFGMPYSYRQMAPICLPQIANMKWPKNFNCDWFLYAGFACFCPILSVFCLFSLPFFTIFISHNCAIFWPIWNDLVVLLWPLFLQFLGCIVRWLKSFSFYYSGEYYLGYKKFDLKGVSWYNLLHPECIKEVQSKHRLSKLIYSNAGSLQLSCLD